MSGEVDAGLDLEAVVLAAWPAYADYPHRVTQMADDLRPHLAAVLEPYVQQRVSEALGENDRLRKALAANAAKP